MKNSSDQRSSQLARPSGASSGRELPSRPGLAAAVAGPPPQIELNGIEITQVVQDMEHTVPLIAGKAAVARVYLSASPPPPEPLKIMGALTVSHDGGFIGEVPSISTLSLDPADNGQLAAKRGDLSKSLNFLLPAAAIAAGNCRVTLTQLVDMSTDDALETPPGAERQVNFVAAAPLRVRVIGIRYQTGPAAPQIEPRALDYNLIRSWLGRAYPVAQVQWSQRTVDGPQLWPFAATDINIFLRGMRQLDVAGGTDHRTHYYGLVSDGGGANFMRGRASAIPGIADPSAVASGPAGAGDFGWDFDGSYGDWYTAHELAHTLGRFHAEFCGAGGGRPYPYDSGQLADNDHLFVGFDVGDASHGIPMQALPGAAWHDVMTYCDNQWVSDFTLNGIRQRLLDEDQIPAPSAGAPAGSPSPSAQPAAAAAAGANPMSGAIHVLAAINVTQKSGRIRFVTALPESQPSQPLRHTGDGPKYVVAVLRNDGSVISSQVAQLVPDECRDQQDDETGTIDILVANDGEATAVTVSADGVELDRFDIGARAGRVRDIRPVTPAGPEAAGGPSGPPRRTALLTWTDDSQAGSVPEGAQPAAAPAAGGVTYHAQLSRDGGQTWETIGFGLSSPQVSLDRSLLSGVDKVQIRVLSTDGFHTETYEQSLDARDL